MTGIYQNYLHKVPPIGLMAPPGAYEASGRGVSSLHAQGRGAKTAAPTTLDQIAQMKSRRSGLGIWEIYLT